MFSNYTSIRNEARSMHVHRHGIRQVIAKTYGPYEANIQEGLVQPRPLMLNIGIYIALFYLSFIWWCGKTLEERIHVANPTCLDKCFVIVVLCEYATESGVMIVANISLHFVYAWTTMWVCAHVWVCHFWPCVGMRCCSIWYFLCCVINKKPIMCWVLVHH